MKANWAAVQEHIHHGDYENIRYVAVDLNDVDAVRQMLNECPYLRLPDPDFGKDAALVSRSYEEILAARQELAERIAKDLAEQGHAEGGWVEWRRMNRAHAPILQFQGWDAEKINRCLGK